MEGFLHTKTALAPQNVNEIVKASSVLHNFIMTQPTSSTSVQQLLEDAPSLSQAEGIRPIRGVGNTAGHEALSVRDSFENSLRKTIPYHGSTIISRGARLKMIDRPLWQPILMIAVDIWREFYYLNSSLWHCLRFNHCWMLVIIPNLMGCIKITKHWNNWQSWKLNMKSCKLHRPQIVLY